MAKNYIEAINKGRNKTIIDYSGNYWYWRTKEFYPVITKKIIAYRNVDGVGTWLHVEDIPYAVDAPNIRSIAGFEYAKFIKFRNSFILYGFSAEMSKPSRIKL